MRSILLFAVLLLASCTFHTNARVWNGVVGPDGKPVYYKSTTQVGWHLFGLWPVFGDARSGAAIEQLTASIAGEHGNHVRIVDEDVSFLWWAVLPITLVFVPTVRSVGAQYQPAGG